MIYFIDTSKTDGFGFNCVNGSSLDLIIDPAGKEPMNNFLRFLHFQGIDTCLVYLPI